MKHRIDSLLQDRKNEQAIEHAKEANPVCRGAAFVAWDEAEKVAAAQDEVHQPSLQFMPTKSIALVVSSATGRAGIAGTRSPALLRSTASQRDLQFEGDKGPHQAAKENNPIRVRSRRCQKAREHRAGLGEAYRSATGLAGPLDCLEGMQAQCGCSVLAQSAVGFLPGFARALALRGSLRICETGTATSAKTTILALISPVSIVESSMM